MTRLRILTVLPALFAVLVSASVMAQDAPFIGVVTDAKVEVRSGAGRAYYVVGELERGDMVRVEKVLFNQTWYQVRVPSGVHSYVSKAFVDAQGDGETGRINADRTEFKAASLRGPGESYRVQGTLNQGDTVQIIGEEGNFYKIVSPQDAFVFITAGTLRQATAADLEAARDEEPAEVETPDVDKPAEPVDPIPPVQPEETQTPTEQPGTKAEQPEPVETPETTTDEPGTTEAPVLVDPVDPVTPEQPADNTAGQDTDPGATPADPGDGWPAPPDVQVQTPARSDALKALEMKLLPYFSLPVADQPLDRMADAYRELQGVEGLPNIDQQIITVRLRTIERRQQILAALDRAEQARQTDHARTVVPEPSDDDERPARYTAVGILQPSGVYDGTSLPLLYRVVDASPSARTIAYVAPNPDINIAAMLNQLVGVVGETTYDRALKLQVIEIERAVVLEAETADESAD